MCSRQHRRPIYYAASLNAVRLNNSEFTLYSMIATLANFGTRIADLKYASRRIRGWRTRKQIGRILAALVRKGYIVKHGPRLYSLTGRVERRDNARLRPLHPWILHAGSNPATAFYCRVLVAIAASRKKWHRLTWRDIRRMVRCDTGTAQALYRALETIRSLPHGGGRAAARRAVFASRRPEWYRYVVHGAAPRRVLMDPRPGGVGLLHGPPGSGADLQMSHRGIGRIGEHVRLCLASRAGDAGPDLDGRPARKQGRQCDQSVAARVLLRIRQRRHSRKLDAIPTAPRPATTAPAQGPDMERDNIPAGSVYESLIAGLPEGIRQRFESSPAVRAERQRRRLQQGYRA